MSFFDLKIKHSLDISQYLQWCDSIATQFLAMLKNK